MSSQQAFFLEINKNNISSLRSSYDSAVKFDIDDYMCRFDTTNSGGANIYFDTDAVKNALFPNGSAHPTSLTIECKFRRGGWLSGVAHVRYRLGGQDLGIDWDWNSVRSDAQRSETITTAAVTGATRASVLSINGYATSYDCYLRWAKFTMIFTRYDFSAISGSNIASTSVSSSTGYDGDSITYSCVLASGATFDGWYDGSTRVSTSQNYTITVAGADKALEARATIPVTTKTLSATYNGAQLQGFPISVQSDVPLSYNGQSKGSVPFSGGAKTFSCAGKIASGNIGIGGKTLLCAGKLMQTDVAVSVT